MQQRGALGWSKGGFSTKIHLRIQGNGLPMTFLLTVRERHEIVAFEALMAQGAVPRIARPRLRPNRAVADKDYSSGKIRRYLRRRGIRYSIPRKENEKHRGKFDKAVYRQRNLVERVSDAEHNAVLTASNSFAELPLDMRKSGKLSDNADSSLCHLVAIVLKHSLGL